MEVFIMYVQGHLCFMLSPPNTILWDHTNFYDDTHLMMHFLMRQLYSALSSAFIHFQSLMINTLVFSLHILLIKEVAFQLQFLSFSRRLGNREREETLCGMMEPRTLVTGEEPECHRVQPLRLVGALWVGGWFM